MRAVWVLVLVLVLAGCGRLGFVDEASWVLHDGPGPGELIGPRLAYHAARHSVILYGGDRSHPPPLDPSDEMWELTEAGWTKLCGPCAPGPRYGHGLAYDADRDRLVLHGGADASAIKADTWEWDGVTWAPVPTASAPPARYDAQLVFDEARHRIVRIGGTDGTSADDAVYTYDGTGWTLATAPGTGPLKLDGQGMHATYDAGAHRVVVAASERGANHDELWAWDGGWTLICSGCTGHPYGYQSLVHDRRIHRVLITGGYDGSQELDGTTQLIGTAVLAFSDLPPARDSSGIAYDAHRDVVVLMGGNGDGCVTGAPNCDETWELLPQ